MNTTQQTNNTKTILVVLAHPDDETFGTGGTLALYAQQGVKVHLVCATRGEVGEMDPKYMQGFSSVGERREAELRCAAGKLGLSGVYFLGYRDSGMPGSPDNQHPNALAAQPVQEVAARVAMYIRKLKPQVVITFDPIGGYRHPDHIAIHNATVSGFSLAASGDFRDEENLPPFQAERLFFHTMPHTFLRVAVFMLRLAGKDPRRFGTNGDIDLVSIAEVRFPTHARINYRKVAHIREEAAACHASQGGGSTGGFRGWLSKILSSSDTYMQAYPQPKTGRLIQDLFDGL